jgi:hypothetical protein
MRQNSDKNLYGLWMRMLLCLVVLSGSSAVLVAQQQPPDQQAPPTESQDVKPAILAMPTYSQNIALLGTDQRYLDLGTLQTKRRTFFMYGMGVSESYVDNFQQNSVGQDSSELLWSPHVAIVNASDHSSFSFQYAPTVTQSVSGPSSRQVFQNGTITFGQPIARNWVLQLSSTDTYGTDSSRLLSPPAFDVNKGVPIADPGSAVFQFDNGKVFTTANDVGLSWQRSPSQSMHFSAQESYFSSLDTGQNSSATFAQMSYSAAVSARTALTVGGNYYHQAFSVGSCDGYGFSFGISRQVGRHINLDVAGGPEFATAPCNKGLGGNYGITISYPLSRRSRVGLTASRSYMTNYLPNTQWSDTAAVTYARQLSQSFEVNLNSGYSRSVRAQTTQTVQGAYVGYFVGADLSWKLSRTIALGAAFRRFEQVSGGPMQGQNVALISLGWNPLPMRIVK